MMGLLDAWLRGGSLMRDPAGRRLRVESLEPRRMLSGQEIDVYNEYGDPMLTGETYALEDTCVGSPVSTEFTITNTGTDTLEIDTGSVVVPEGFSVQFNGSSSLGAGESMTLIVTATATSDGTFDGNLSFGTNDADEDPYLINVTVDVSPDAPEATLLDSQWSEIVDGGTFDLGHDPSGAPLSEQFTVSNDGSGTLTLGTLQGFTGEFTLVDQTNWGSLEPGEYATFTVEFYTETEGQYEANLSFTTNDADEGVYNVKLTAYYGNMAPTTTGIADVSVYQNPEDDLVEEVNLWDSFEDAEDGDFMTYQVVSVQNEYLFDSYDIDQSTGILTLDFAPLVVGDSLITVRATDSGGKSVDAVFNVEVIQVLPNQSPTIVDFAGEKDPTTGLWTFTGRVIDEDPTSLLVTFDGLLEGYSVTTDSRGYFTLTVSITDPGTVTAVTTDDEGLQSGMVWRDIFYWEL